VPIVYINNPTSMVNSGHEERSPMKNHQWKSDCRYIDA